MVEILEPVLIWVVSVGPMIEVVSRGILHSIFIVGILQKESEHMEQWRQRTYSVFLLIIHERSNGPTLVGTGSGLSTNTNSSTANAEMVSGARDSTEGRRHLVRS